MAYASFEDLEVWKRACRMAERLYSELRDSRNYALKDQMTRAGISVPSNIAEGHERSSTREFVRFLNIAKGSSGELRTQLYIAKRVGELETATADEMIAECKEIGAMLQGLIRSISHQLGEPAEEFDFTENSNLKTENSRDES